MFAVGAEEQDLNSYYHFPVSVSVQYQPLSGIGNRDLSEFDIYEISSEFRFPFRSAPSVQPVISAGIIEYTFLGDIDVVNQDWSHRHIYISPGFSYSTRLSREFELGLDFFGGVSQSFFSELTLDGQPSERGQLNIIGSGSLRLGLNPSFNTSIAVLPGIRYLYALGSMHTYDGFTFGVGFSVSYRFGKDPDAPQSAVRAIRFVETAVPPVFAAMQSYYAVEPLGSVTIMNSEKMSIEDVSVSFLQAGFMDSPTPCITVDELLPGEEVEVPILATFNNNIFSTQGVTPLIGEIIVSYTAKGKPVDQHHSVSYDLHDKNALTWDDDQKVAAFITPSDSAIRNYSSYIRRDHRDLTNKYLSPNLQFAIQAYNALTEIGVMYQIDPTSPFTEVQDNTLFVDSISLPRETLSRRTGDCDDLTVLFNTMMESVGIQTAFVTTPGHIFSAFNTGFSAAQYSQVHPDRDMLVVIDGQIWVLVEVTLLGRAGFLEAWNTGVSEYRAHDNNPGVRGFYVTSNAQKIYRSIALQETDLGLQYGDAEAARQRFKDDMDKLSGAILEPHITKANKDNSIRSWNTYGIAAAQLGSYTRAESAFQKILVLDPDNLNGALNLGALYFLRDKFDQALTVFIVGEQSLSQSTHTRKRQQLNLYLNLSKTHYALGNYPEARSYYESAQQVDPDKVANFAYLATAVDTGKASEAANAEPILFFNEE